MSQAHKTLLSARGDALQFDIPDKGLAAFRMWPGFGCDAEGNNCAVGQSGGPHGDGFSCPAGIGCAPGIDSKFEGTFGCLASVPSASCQLNPVDSQPLPRVDGWDTSAVDGFTAPFKVVVSGTCADGPTGNLIDCSGLTLSRCPTSEEINGTATDLLLSQPGTAVHAGCMSPCSKLTLAQWNPDGSYGPSSTEAAPYCCPTPPVSVPQCRSGVGASTEYVAAIHAHCGNTYAYAYDDLLGNFTCDAGTKYDVTFYCPE